MHFGDFGKNPQFVNLRISTHCNVLFTDTEAGEDGVENFLGGDGAGDGAEVVDSQAEFEGDEVAGLL